MRSMNLQKFLREKTINLIRENLKNSLMAYGLDSWFGLRISLLNLFMVQIPSFAIMIYFFKSGFEPNKMAFLIFAASNIVKDTMYLVLQTVTYETQMISLERCSHFESIEPEDNYFEFHENISKLDKIVDKGLDVSGSIQNIKIVTEGKLEFKNVGARYKANLPKVFSDLSFVIKPREKIGVIGRSGAGKTSLIKLFWQCLKPCEGQILVDGVDISNSNLKALRNQMMVVSQDTALFEGTLRENMDPLYQVQNDQVLKDI